MKYEQVVQDDTILKQKNVCYARTRERKTVQTQIFFVTSHFVSNREEKSPMLTGHNDDQKEENYHLRRHRGSSRVGGADALHIHSRFTRKTDGCTLSCESTW